MAHQIETGVNGTARMMYTGETPWHGLGTKLDAPPTVAEGIKAAGLDWAVRLDPLYRCLPSENGLVASMAVDAYATVRESDETTLGVVGPRYQPLQNIDAFKFFDPFLESKAATLHTAGCLDGGRRVWVLAHVAGSKTEIVPGDRVDSFILLSNSHDGTLAVRVGFTPIRVVCANTLASAHKDLGSKLLRVRHTKSVTETLDMIRDVMGLVQREFRATTEQYRALAARHVNASDLRKYVRRVLELPEDASKDSTRSRNQIGAIIRRAEIGDGQDMPLVRGTYWAAYNGITEWLSRERGHNRDSRLDSLWFGSSAEMSRRALELALSMAS